MSYGNKSMRYCKNVSRACAYDLLPKNVALLAPELIFPVVNKAEAGANNATYLLMKVMTRASGATYLLTKVITAASGATYLLTKVMTGASGASSATYFGIQKRKNAKCLAVSGKNSKFARKNKNHKF